MHHLENIFKKVNSGSRIDADDALILLNHAGILDLADLASRVRKKLHPEPIVTYVVDRNINYTNICKSGCRFCAFYHDSDKAGGYVISEKDLAAKIKETISIGGTQILLQGGLNPTIHFKDYLKMLRFIKDNFEIHIHGFSPPEILFMAEKSSLTITETLTKLMEAGLGSIPGGGAEILVDDVRNQISPNKYLSEQWLDVMRTAHKLGLKTTATMMFGHIETNEHIIEHLIKIRDLQK
ncbi:MAG: radical SAM protein, partial [Deltaproteobacteria bacterium]|nr:radical SAM protein [Deltaproteobacteria bacterium]